MRTIVDTCVLSEIRRPRADEQVQAAVAAICPDDAFLSALTIGELVQAVERLPASAKRRALESWLREIQSGFANQILSIDAWTARRWGELSTRARANGRPLPVVDGLLAATALRHDMALMTRNLRHFEGTGVFVVDPWSGS